MTLSLRDRFLQQIIEEARGENVGELGDRDIAVLAEGLWDWAAALPGDARSARIRPLQDGENAHRDGWLLEAAGPDAPFLVDSLLGECVERGLEVRALLHPIVPREAGAALSLIQIHLAALSDVERAGVLAGAQATLADITAAVDDYAAMRSRMQQEALKLAGHAHLDPVERDEAVAFLDWLVHEHFVFLGSRAYDFDVGQDGAFRAEEPLMIEGSNLGLLRDEARNILNRGAEPTVLTAEIEAFLQKKEPLIIAKSTMRSRVHRRALADYIGIKQYDEHGRVCGEIRFAGLFTSEAYNETVPTIPIVRRRAQQLLAASGRLQSRHSEKALSNILETWPRDELFQTDVEILTPMIIGALHLVGQPRARLFVRYDEFDRYASALVYVLRDAYTSDLRQKIGDRLAAAFGGEVLNFQPRFDGGPLARVHFEVARGSASPRPDVESLERDIATMARRWDDAFAGALADAPLTSEARAGAAAFKGAFNGAYREAFDPEEAILDLVEIAELNAGATVRLRAYRRPGDPAEIIRAKIYARDGAIPLSKCVPVFENMGLFVEFETGYPVRPKAKPTADAPDVYWIHDARMRLKTGGEIDLEAADAAFEAAFAAVWTGQTEDDGFNQLILAAGATWREAALLRALCAFRKQTGLDPAQPTQIEALVAHPGSTLLLLQLFKT